MKTKSIFAIALMGLVFLVACPPPQAAARLVIKGKVIDAGTLAPIPGTFVEIENASGGSGYSRAYTDEKGEFAFQDLPAGVSFNLYAEQAGFTSFRRLYWYVEKNKEVESIVLRLNKEGVFQCRITESDKTTPIKRTRVFMKPMQWRGDPYAVYEFERETGDNGMVRFDKIPAGSYELAIEKSGFVRERLTNIRFMKGKTRSMDIALYRPGSISGRVLLGDGETTLAGIPIIARGPSAGTSTSNFKGIYALRDLKPGTYAFTASKSGFKPYTYKGHITIKEGEDIRHVDHLLTAEQEKVRIAIYQEVYPLKKEIKFTVRAFRSEDFKLEFFKVPISWYLKNPHAFQGLLQKGSSLKPFDMVHSDQYGFKRYRPYTWFTKEVKIDKAFSPGIYLIRATTAHAEDRNFIFVSNIGVIVKRGKDTLLAYAVNFENNQPEADVDLFVLKGSPPKKNARKSLFQQILRLFRNDQILSKAKTDKEGLFQMKEPVPASRLLVVGMKTGQGLAIAESHLSHAAKTQGLKSYFYTDRPLYRPGHRVFFKGVLRGDDGKGLKIKKNFDTVIRIKDSQGRVVHRWKDRSDAMGTVNGSFDLSSEAPLGRYSLWVDNRGSLSQAAYFFVQAYRKPDFRVDVKTDKKAYVTDETVKCSIQAAYFFGSPLKNVPVTYRVYQKMTRKPYYRHWWEGEYYRRGGYQSLIKNGKGKTDSQGFFSMEFTPGPKSYDRLITVEAEVMPSSGRRVSGRTSVIFNQSLYNVEISRPPFVHKMDQPLRLRIDVKDIEGNPISTTFSAALEQEVWNPIRNRYEKPVTPLYMEEFNTDAKGTAMVEIPISELEPGYTRFMVFTTDPKGTRVSKSLNLWLYDSLKGDFNYNYAGLEIWLDKENYKVGEKARLLINSPVEKGVVLFTMEGQEILEQRVLNMDTRTRILEIPVKKTFAPNIYLSVIQHNGNRLHHKKVSLNAAIEGKEMTIGTRFDKKEYRPGDTARIDINATDQKGAPVQGDFSLGVVDEAIYYIRPDHTTPMGSFFYAKRSPWIATTYSFPIRYLGGAVKSAGSRFIRKDFRDTAFWLPNFSTDKNGKASVEIPLPDNLTTWVTTIRGHSAQNVFGEQKAKSLVTKPLITSLKLPRFFRRGDQTEVRVINHNRTDLPLDIVKNTLNVQPPVSIEGSSVQVIQIPKRGQGQLSWQVKVGKGEGKTVITVHTVSKSLQDGEQRTLPIGSRGLPKHYDFAGRTRERHARIGMPLAPGHVLGMTSLEMEFTPHPALAGLTSLDYLAHFPYGCVEQTLNSFVPLVAYYGALERMGLQPQEKLKKKIERGLAKLAGFQRPDGSFGWWRNSNGDLYLTSLVLLGLSQIKEMPDTRIKQSISRAVKYVNQQILKTRVPDLLVFGLYALSEAGYHNRVLATALKTKLASMDPLALSLTTLALSNHRMPNEAKEAADRLLEEIENSPEGSWFPEPASHGNRNAIETAAFALTALLRTYPDHPEVDRVLNWLVLQKTGKYWVSTKTTGFVLFALSEYLKARGHGIFLQDQTISITLNGKKAPNFYLKRADYLKEKGPLFSLPSEWLTHGENVLTIESGGELYYSIRVKSFFEADRITPASQNCDMGLSKKVFAANRVHDARGNPRILSRPYEPGEHLRVGGETRVEIRFTPDRDYAYFILEDGLPSGFEVVDFKRDAGISWWQPYSHKERRDDRVVFFFTRLRKGKEVSVEYILRSELNGDYHLPPARLYGMYRPTISSHSGSGRLRVTSRK
ncbi:MAG: carboxypeptidase regulatory-like domain-containing protein [Deltaproteobacteria bacterium]|nr:carboxypeptidase regulatory-like domain-containing protein [Deltaproteobacteria bacterium]